MTFNKAWTEEEVSFEVSNGFPIVEQALLDLNNYGIKDETVREYTSLILNGLSLNGFHLKKVIKCLLERSVSEKLLIIHCRSFILLILISTSYTHSRLLYPSFISILYLF